MALVIYISNFKFQPAGFLRFLNPCQLAGFLRFFNPYLTKSSLAQNWDPVKKRQVRAATRSRASGDRASPASHTPVHHATAEPEGKANRTRSHGTLPVPVRRHGGALLRRPFRFCGSQPCCSSRDLVFAAA
jgi:hypothetical protein